MGKQIKLKRFTLIFLIPILLWNGLLGFLISSRLLLAGIGWGPSEYNALFWGVLFVILLAFIYSIGLGVKKDEFVKTKSASIALLLLILPSLLFFSFGYFIQKNTIILSRESLSLSDHRLVVDDFQHKIAVSEDSFVQGVDNIMSTELSPDGKWLIVIVDGGWDVLNPYRLAWLYDMTTKKLVRPIAFHYGGMGVREWKSDSEIVLVFITNSDKYEDKVFNISELPDYPKVIE